MTEEIKTLYSTGLLLTQSELVKITTYLKEDLNCADKNLTVSDKQFLSNIVSGS